MRPPKKRAVARRTSDEMPFGEAASISGPAASTLDLERLVTTDPNRWNGRGKPTLYAGRDAGVALAEFGRHWRDEHDPSCVWSIRLHLTSVLDLRQPEVRADLGLPADSTWFLDRGACSSLADRVRAAGAHDGLIVPSVAFLDDMERWNAVIFADRLRVRLAEAVTIVGASHRLTPS
jgi:RES domain-containing protein